MFYEVDHLTKETIYKEETDPTRRYAERVSIVPRGSVPVGCRVSILQEPARIDEITEKDMRFPNESKPASICYKRFVRVLMMR